MAFAPIGMPILSHRFIHFARCGHLKFKGLPLYMAITAIWPAAFFKSRNDLFAALRIAGAASFMFR